ncbi:hypothetical protein OHA18_25900 [Kribbella sp. NBC_00709]|uniref:NaeI family type II restriction endonuclease n=1 Tax=Kribbella sp. NBC_00709 TaxID=2975972 RepID=UPI002E29CB26|nr:NaeI family type II restriction endonuclease [Kribbella sp. NBC_00709]
MSVRRLCAAFTVEHFPTGAIPAEATVHRRLNGEGLANHWPLVPAVIAVCTPAAERRRVTRQAEELNRKARRDPTLLEPDSARHEDLLALKSTNSRLRNKLVEAREGLATQTDHRLRAERSLLQVHQLNLLLLRMLASPSAADGSPGVHDSAKLAHLEQQLSQLRAANLDGSRLLSESERRISNLERVLAIREGTSSTSSGRSPTSHPQPPRQDRAIPLAFAQAIRALDPDGRLFADVFRRTLDTLYDGAHTGRFRWDQLLKTEKTHLGTLVEIELRRAFPFRDGQYLDFEHEGFEFDLKFSVSNNWMIPAELIGKLCMLVTVNDSRSIWSAGVLEITPGLVRQGTNRDGKATLTPEGRAAIEWIHLEAQLPENVLLHMPAEDVSHIFKPRSAQGRVNELLRRAEGKLIRHVTTEAVAMQQDAARRVRFARQALQPEGILVLDRRHRELAAHLELPVPDQNEVVSVRVALVDDQDPDERPAFHADGGRWAIARPEDPTVPAPLLTRAT